MYDLPPIIQMKIYEYDCTYHDIFDNVLIQLMTQYHTWHEWYKYVDRRESIRLLEDRISIKIN